MRILLVTHYFWPENLKINDFALQLAKKGHQITVITGKPNYPIGSYFKGYTFAKNNSEYWNDISILRCPVITRGSGSNFRLIFNWLSLPLFASLRLLFIKEKFDKIFVYQPSPFTIAIPALLAKKKFRAPIYFWVQDIWPETLSAAGGIKNKLILSIIDKFVNYTYRKCKVILVQSQSFIEKIRSKEIDQKKIVYFPNSTESFYKPIPKSEAIEKKLPIGNKVMFAGNIGEAQSFDTILDAAKLVKEKGLKVSWIILGDGRRKKQAMDKATNLGIDSEFIFLGSFPSSEMPKYFSSADALLVSLKKEPIFELTIPNKIQSYMACGKPIIGSLEGEGAKIIIESNSGYVSEPENAIALADKVIEFFKLKDSEKKQMGTNARTYFDREFNQEILVKKFELILNS